MGDCQNDDLQLDIFVTNLNKHSKNVVKFYHGRGAAEQWFKWEFVEYLTEVLTPRNDYFG